MNHGKLESALRDLRSVMRLPKENEISDDELVRRYAEEREEAAFAALVRRYGPMVLRVCYRVLHRSHDAEDAFQATFLTLAREATTLRQRGAVGAWIHEVAYNVSLRVRQRLARQRHYEEKHVPPMNHDNLEEGILRDDVQTVLYEELHRLPEKYRLPLVLCNLLGRTHEEASRELGLERSALSKRLKRAYGLLRQRLLGRGIALSMILLASLLHEEGKAAPVSTDLLLRTVRAMVGSASDSAAVSATVAALATKGAGGWLLGSMKMAHVLIVSVVMFAGGGIWAVRSWNTSTPNQPAAFSTGLGIVPPHGDPSAFAAEIGSRRQKANADTLPSIEVRGTILDLHGRPIAGAQVVACSLRSFRPGKRNVRDEVLVRGRADEAGRFRLNVPRPDGVRSLRTAFVHLWAAASGHAPATLRLTWRPDPPSVEMRLQPPDVIRGQLLGDDGRPAANVRLLVSRIGLIHLEPIQGPGRDSQRKPPLWPMPLTTDANGRFALHGLNLDEGVGLRVCDDRFALRRVALEPKLWRGKEGTVRLAPARLLEGRIAGGGSGLAGARLSVVVRDEAKKPLGSALDVRADATGAFRMRLPVGASYNIEALAPDGAPYVGIARELIWPKDALRHELELSLPRGALVRGVVTDADNGLPVPGAHIQFRPLDGAVIAPELLTGLSNPAVAGVDGSFRLVVPKVDGFAFVHEPSGDYVMEEWTGRLRGLSGQIHAHRVLAVDAASGPEVRDVGVILRRGVCIEGRVLGPDGESAGDGAWLCRGRTCFDKLTEGQPQPYWNGRFTLRGCVPGRIYPVLFLDSRRRLGVKAELLAVADGKPVDVRLQPCGSANVRFVEERGRPVAGHQPYLYVMVPSDRASEEEDGTETVSAEMHELDEFDPDHYRHEPRTDAEGRVTLPALIPGVRYRMSHYRDASGAWREIEAMAGQTLSLPDVVLYRHR